jgi:hypothetical protein
MFPSRGGEDEHSGIVIRGPRLLVVSSIPDRQHHPFKHNSKTSSAKGKQQRA